MDNKDPFNDFWVEWGARLIASALLATLIWVMCSCHSTKYIPVETVRTDSVYFSTFLRDSIYVKDSIYIKEKNDTVFVDKYKYIYKYVNLTDTVFIERCDTIRVPVPVEREPSFWDKTRQSATRIIKIAIFAITIYLLVRWRIRKKSEN